MPATDFHIKKNCPKCGNDRKNIEYYNCGPIRYIKCPKCMFVMKEGVDSPIGKLFDAWNENLND